MSQENDYDIINRRKESAKRLLIHYFDLAGVVQDNDSRVEIGEIVDSLFDAAVLAAAYHRQEAVGA